MRKGLRTNEEAQIIDLVGKGTSKKDIYALFSVQPSAIDKFISGIEGKELETQQKTEHVAAEKQVGINEAVKAALIGYGIIDTAGTRIPGPAGKDGKDGKDKK